MIYEKLCDCNFFEDRMSNFWVILNLRNLKITEPISFKFWRPKSTAKKATHLSQPRTYSSNGHAIKSNVSSKKSPLLLSKFFWIHTTVIPFLQAARLLSLEQSIYPPLTKLIVQNTGLFNTPSSGIIYKLILCRLCRYDYFTPSSGIIYKLLLCRLRRYDYFPALRFTMRNINLIYFYSKSIICSRTKNWLNNSSFDVDTSSVWRSIRNLRHIKHVTFRDVIIDRINSFMTSLVLKLYKHGLRLGASEKFWATLLITDDVTTINSVICQDR